MNRRGFLQSIFATAAAPAIVRIGSLMPVRSIVIPEISEILSINAIPQYAGLLTIDMITREALRVLNKNITFVHGINQSYEEEFAHCDTVKIIRPPLYS